MMEYTVPGEDFWTDLTGTGTLTTAYTFTDGDTTAARGLDSYWNANPAASGGTGCVKMLAAQNHTFGMDDCTMEAYFVCRKPGTFFPDLQVLFHT